jgi:hypothetical protein
VIDEMNRLVDESNVGDLSIIAFSGHRMVVHAYPHGRKLDAPGPAALWQVQFLPARG